MASQYQRQKLNAFFNYPEFFLGVIRQTRAVLSSGGERGHDWWSVDFFEPAEEGGNGWELVHRPTVLDRAKGQHIHFQMITEDDLRQLQSEAGSDDETILAETLRKHPEMLTLVKQEMRQQL